MEKSLEQYLKDNSKFLKLADGESADLIYLSYKVSTNRFDAEKDTVIWKLQYPDSEKTITWEQGSAYVVKAMNAMKPGEYIRIKRTGEGTKTRYEVTSLSKDMTKAA